MPGMNAMPHAATPAIMIAVRDWVSCVPAVEPRSDSAFERVTIMPVETAIRSAGIWVTRPSPMVRMPYLLSGVADRETARASCRWRCRR